MIENLDIARYVHVSNSYFEPKFSSVCDLSDESILISYQGHDFYPYILNPKTMGDLRKLALQIQIPVILDSEMDIDVLDDLFNIRQNLFLARRYIVRFGLGHEEFSYAKKMLANKFKWFLLQVPHGAHQSVVDQVIAFRMIAPDAVLMVGNFYNQKSIDDFVMRLNSKGAYRVDFWQMSLDEHIAGMDNEGFASIAKTRQAGYSVVSYVDNLSAKVLLFSLASGATWIHAKNYLNLNSEDDWQLSLHKEIKEIMKWQDVLDIKQTYEMMFLKWRNSYECFTGGR